ncbi:Mu transposase C-terminal domain-containing protein [Methylacidimicrobium tartarophylax]|uniref:Transposon Tn7 transposition protein TnsB n=1 Tax=Methylacidimicrobium tartarophylax TaxID=1041768 RepID=A0A5E6MNZ2_9BACT|nr:Mu transposase C-terminal domain-containing protein [Methylacidimicrobium tartarophylax]VVM07714.1 Transposon Tn7 transposition protein TnsB [Methylacidimicrobium tartarophylax]
MSDENKSGVPSRGIPSDRRNICLREGEFVQVENAVYQIEKVLDFKSVVGVDVKSGRSSLLRVGELRPMDSGPMPPVPDLLEIMEEEWRIAQERFNAIRPFVDCHRIGRSEVENRAKDLGVDPVTIYRWLRRYRAQGRLTALIPMKSGWRRGRSRIPKDADGVIQEVIRDFYLSPQRPTAQKTVDEVRRRCWERGVSPPSPSTVRARIAGIPERERLRRRGFRERARNKFRPAAGSFPNADFPLSVVQIDHTPADIALVDDLYRKPIGRPWITLAVDVFSRVVTGYYLSFDPPSETSVALCVAHSILPKEEWLLAHGVKSSWPVWGYPKTIHVDNGADFRSDDFKNACLDNGINLEFRPVKRPNFGGHIERLFGTLLEEIHHLPGTTFSSVAERDEHDPEKTAAMTKTEFEEWLVRIICEVYHQRIHSEIGMTPLRKWEIGIFGTGGVPGIGVPLRPADPMKLLLDFLPSFRRTVQAFGVSIDGLTYYAEVLRPWINATDPMTKRKREFIFRRDPRDISVIWFRDPEIKQYCKVPFADQSRPPLSLWEYREVRQELRKEGIRSANEHQIFRALTELREKVAESQEKTKRARRQAQRRREHERKASPAAAVDPPVKTTTEALLGGLLSDENIEPFEDIA